MLKFLGFFTRLAIPPVIGALLMPTIIQALLGRGLLPDMPVLLERTWLVLTWPPLFSLGIFLAGWWCATIHLELTDRRDHDPELLEQARLKSVLRRTIRGLAWPAIPRGIRRYQVRRANEALEAVGFPAPDDTSDEGLADAALRSKSATAYYEIVYILTKRLGFPLSREISSELARTMFKPEPSPPGIEEAIRAR